MCCTYTHPLLYKMLFVHAVTVIGDSQYGLICTQSSKGYFDDFGICIVSILDKLTDRDQRARYTLTT
ncbi:hypothetical protein D3C85_1847190 [compost metagenome]